MGTLYTEDFEGGTAPAVIDNSASSFSVMSGINPWTLSTIGERSGLIAGQCSGTGANQYGQWTLPAATSIVFKRFYFTASGTPGGTVSIIQGASNGSNRWRLQFNASGQLQITNNNTALGTSSANVCNGLMWRIEVDVNGGTITCRIYGGDNVESATPTQTLTGTYTSGTFNQIRMGTPVNPSPVSFTYWVDDVEADNASNPGPGAALPTFTWHEWAGNAEVALTVAGEWNGTTLVPLKTSVVV